MFELYKNAASTVPSASTDRVRLFVDTDGLPKIKNSAGTVTSLKGDPGEGVAVGGTTGQVLAKASGTDYDTEWVDQAGALITSVNGQTGVVVLDAADVGAEPADATILKDAAIGVTVQGYSAVLAGTTASFTTADETKLDGIQAGAEVNVNADWNAVSGDAQILNKPTLGTAAATDSTDYATAAQGALADSALQAADIGVTVQGYSAVLAGTTASFTTADETKLDGIEAGAEVNVNADWNAVSGDAQILNKPTLYSDASVDTHLNTATATTDQVLSWNGTDYDWVDQSGGGGGALTISNKTAAYTVVAGDLGTIINCTSGTFSVSLTAAATLGAGFNCWIWNTSTTATHAITIDPSGAETIDGRTTLILRRGEGVRIVCDGTNWQTGDKKAMRGYADNIDTGAGDAPIASGDGSLALSYASTASGGASVAIGTAATASGLRSLAVGRSATASSSYATAIGANSSVQGSQAVTGSGAMALGGSYASGADSFAAAVANNTSTYGALNSNTVSIGYQSKASGLWCAAIGYSTQATGHNSTSVGRSSIASGAQSLALGYQATASGVNSCAIGRAAKSEIYGKYSYSAMDFGSSSLYSQEGKYVLLRETTDATATVLTTDNTAASTTNQVVLQNNAAYAFSGIVIAKRSGSTNAASWKVEGMVVRGANAASATLVASTVTAISNVPGWTLALSADTTNGGLAVTATGAAATNIRWVATIQTSEVTY